VWLYPSSSPEEKTQRNRWTYNPQQSVKPFSFE
jgi:hypothetical protein